MKTSSSTPIFLASIYPEHLWIEVDFVGVQSLDRPKLNQVCLEKIHGYLQQEMGVSVTEVTPSRSSINNFIWKLVNGFILGIEGVRVGFIPSEHLDIQGFDVPQEWVDLPNWVADYYVPIQVDRASNCLRLWGFISHHDLKTKSHFDPIAQNYEVSGDTVINEIEALWMSCELQADGELMPQPREIKPVAR